MSAPPQQPPPPYSAYPSNNPPPAYPDQTAYQQQQRDPEYASPPANESSFSNFSEDSVRRGFIRKVYTILMAQLIVTVGFICLFCFVESIKHWVQRHLWFYILAFVTFLITYIVLVCCSDVRRRYPGNFIALSVFTIALSYLTGVISSYHEAWAVLIAMSICAMVCLGVTLFAAFAPIDFTKCTAFLWFFGLAFLLFGLACMITWAIAGPNKVLQAVYGGIGAILFSLYLCYDTQMILGGRRYELSEEEYITGALELYMDVVQIFLMLLMLIGIGEH